MAQVKEYYPSLAISDYTPGEFCMFIRNVTYDPKKIGEQHKQYLSLQATPNGEGGLEPDWEEEGGLAPDNGGTDSVGGLEPDTEGEKPSGKKGGLAPDVDGKESIEKTFEKYNKKKKRYACYSYEAGRIIGINKKEDKIYVQFENTGPEYCHIFKAGIPSDSFDIIDRLLQADGK